MLIRPCHAIYGVIVDTKQDEDKSNFIFLLGAGLFMSYSKMHTLSTYEFITGMVLQGKMDDLITILENR